MELAAILLASTAPLLAGNARPEVAVNRDQLTVPSNLMVEREVGVMTRVSGVVVSIQADRGTRVRKGDPLATLDQREFRLDLSAAQETFHMRQAEYRRYQELHQQQLASESELEQRKAAYELARVELERVKLLINRSVIRSPIDGVVVERFARVGQKVMVDDSVVLFKVTSLEPLLARAYLPENMLGKVRLGDTVRVVSTEFPDVTAPGRISFISPVIEASSGSFQMIVTVKTDGKKIMRPGMAVNLVLNSGN